MRYYISDHLQTIFFWLPKTGVTSFLEAIEYMETGVRWSKYEYDEQIHSQKYWSSKQKLVKGNYKTVFLYRPVHERILSGFLDKYVHVSSPVPSAGVPDCDTFEEFINLLNTTALCPKKLKENNIDPVHFGPLKTKAFKQFELLSESSVDVCIRTPLTAFPEGKIIQSSGQMKQLVEKIAPSLQYSNIKHKYTENPGSINIWNHYKDKINYYKGPAEKLTKKQLQKFQRKEKNRTIPLECFYPKHLHEMVCHVYSDEINFVNTFVDK